MKITILKIKFNDHVLNHTIYITNEFFYWSAVTLDDKNDCHVILRVKY